MGKVYHWLRNKVASRDNRQRSAALTSTAVEWCRREHGVVLTKAESGLAKYLTSADRSMTYA